MLKLLKYCTLLVSLCAPIFAQQPSPVISIESTESIVRASKKHNLIEICKELCIDATQIGGLALVIFALATIAHESGHAIAMRSLFDVKGPIHIHIGTTTPESTTRLFSLGNMHFYKTIPWMSGLTHCLITSKRGWESYRHLCLGIMNAAGGLSAATLEYALLSAITAYCAYCDNKGLSEITLKSFINSCSPFSYILHTKALSYGQKRFLFNATLVICISLIFNIFYGLTPCFSIGDGIDLWEKHIGVTGTPLKIIRGLSIAGVWGCWALLIKKYYDARKQLSSQYNSTNDTTDAAASSSPTLEDTPQITQ